MTTNLMLKKNLKTTPTILSKLTEQIKPIFLYKVNRLSREVKYDTYDSFICAATSVNNARKIHPTGAKENFDDKYLHRGWVNKEDINTLTVTRIGIAEPGIEEDTLIIASYNAG